MDVITIKALNAARGAVHCSDCGKHVLVTAGWKVRAHNGVGGGRCATSGMDAFRPLLAGAQLDTAADNFALSAAVDATETVYRRAGRSPAEWEDDFEIHPAWKRYVAHNC